MPIAPYIEFGSTSFELPDARIVQRSDDLDSLTVEWQTPSLVSFQRGGQPPRYPGMTIDTIESTEEIPGVCYLHRLSCLGAVGEKPEKLIKKSERLSADGWDEAFEEYLTRSPDSHASGDSLAGAANMFAVDVDKELMRPGLDWYRVRKSHRGLKADKPYARRITVNGSVVSPSQNFVNLLPGGWGTSQKGQLSLPKVVVQDSYVSTTPPPTASIPGQSTPPDAPPINLDIEFAGMDLVFNWPKTWRLESVESDQIPGKSVWLIRLTYEFAWVAQPA